MHRSAFEQAITLHQAGQLGRARELYEQAIANQERVAACWGNLSVIEFQLGDYPAAKRAADQAIALDPDNGNNYNNLGLAYKGLQDEQAAINAFRESVARSPEHGIAWANLAGMLYHAKAWDQGVRAAENAIRFAPDYDPSVESALYIKLETASWIDLDQIVQLGDRRIRQGGAINPYALFSCCVDPQILLAAGRNRSAVVANEAGDAAPWSGRAVQPSGKIRIGYFSSNLRTHATGYLIREMIRLHDRNRFELLALPYSRSPEDDFTRDLLGRFDRVINLAEATNAVAVETIRSLHLDVMIDINGHADGGRTAVTAARCAPLQVAWLGHAAPMGAPFIDYTISDRNVTPDRLLSTFSEAVLRLPRTYYPSDPHRVVSDRFTARGQLGLPESELVFCAFNQTRKITPPVVEAWAKLLHAHPRSVLWLWELNAVGARNINAFFSRLGIDNKRIVWAPSLPSPDHLCRYRFADLYLDTFPYNGHTMVSDALYMGLPVVTLAGNTMPSRVAASFLTLLGVDGLIANDLQGYLNIAHQLASSPELRREAREKIIIGAKQSRLFSAEAFVRDFEAGLEAIVNRARQGKAPTTMDIAR